MQFIVRIVGLTVVVFFSCGIALTAAITTYLLVYRPKSKNKREAMIDALKDSLVFFVGLLFFTSAIYLINRMI